MKKLNKILDYLLRAAAVIIITAPFADKLCELAYLERGYTAVGGEWAAILLVAAGLWKLTGYVAKANGNSVENVKRRVQTRSDMREMERGKDI